MNRCLALSQIRVDGGTQPREAIDQATVDEYADAMTRLVIFPPLVVYHDGVDTWLADGFHRYHAALRVGAQGLDVEWRIGTLEMAKLYAASANAAHGLRRTLGDKRRAIEMVLSTDVGRGWTQEQIARHCNVNQSSVSRVKAAYASHTPQKNPQPAKVTAADRKRMRIAEVSAANPAASHSSIGRQLGVDRETVAKVRANAPPRRRASASTIEPRPRRSGCSVPADGYSSVRAQAAASGVLAAARAARPRMTRGDQRRLLEEISAEMEA